MAEGLNVDAQAIARRCTVKSPDYDQLTPLDWVVLDFTDGLRTFESMLSFIPVTKSDLAASFIHLRLLGFLTWNSSDKSDVQAARNQTANTHEPQSSYSGYVPSGMSQSPRSQSSGGISSLSSAGVSLEPAIGSFTDEICFQYLPQRLMNSFRRFQPTLVDSTLDLSIEMQYFTEYLHQNLASLSPYDLLGLTEGQCTKADVRQAYLLRTKQFHPDRYFRKNIGPFAPRIAAIFKAVTGAFTTLQSKLKS